ncbi:MAG: hypothetical protein JW982_17010 [Spirochaetes bacterium]|nr:hypothetical protein [Spirochaetota bacterium]
MKIQCIELCDLEHRAAYMSSDGENLFFMAASPEGKITVLDHGFRKTAFMDLKRNIADMSADFISGTAAVVFPDTGLISVFDFNFKTVFETAPEDKYISCFFQNSSGILWCINKADDSSIEFHVYDTVSWKLLSTCRVMNDFINPDCRFSQIPGSKNILLCISGESDERSSHVLNYDNGVISANEMKVIADYIFPEFSPAGNEFLTGDYGNIYRYVFPEMLPAGFYSYNWDYGHGDFICYVDENTALFNTSTGRIFTLNTERMILLNEIIIAGHEPEAPALYYPSLSPETEMCTDIMFIRRFGSKAAAVFRRDKNLQADQQKDSLMFFELSQFRAV